MYYRKINSKVLYSLIHVVLISDAATISCYIDGVSQTMHDTTITDDLTIKYIGKGGNSASNRYFDGEIDDLCIYDKVLTAAEVTRNYNAGKRSHR